LFTPVERSWSIEQAALISIQPGVPLQKPKRRDAEVIYCRENNDWVGQSEPLKYIKDWDKEQKEWTEDGICEDFDEKIHVKVIENGRTFLVVTGFHTNVPYRVKRRSLSNRNERRWE